MPDEETNSPAEFLQDTELVPYKIASDPVLDDTDLTGKEEDPVIWYTLFTRASSELNEFWVYAKVELPHREEVAKQMPGEQASEKRESGPDVEEEDTVDTDRPVDEYF